MSWRSRVSSRATTGTLTPSIASRSLCARTRRTTSRTTSTAALWQLRVLRLRGVSDHGGSALVRVVETCNLDGGSRATALVDSGTGRGRANPDYASGGRLGNSRGNVREVDVDRREVKNYGQPLARSEHELEIYGQVSPVNKNVGVVSDIARLGSTVVFGPGVSGRMYIEDVKVSAKKPEVEHVPKNGTSRMKLSRQNAFEMCLFVAPGVSAAASGELEAAREPDQQALCLRSRQAAADKVRA